MKIDTSIEYVLFQYNPEYSPDGISMEYCAFGPRKRALFKRKPTPMGGLEILRKTLVS